MAFRFLYIMVLNASLMLLLDTVKFASCIEDRNYQNRGPVVVQEAPSHSLYPGGISGNNAAVDYSGLKQTKGEILINPSKFSTPVSSLEPLKEQCGRRLGSLVQKACRGCIKPPPAIDYELLLQHTNDAAPTELGMQHSATIDTFKTSAVRQPESRNGLLIPQSKVPAMSQLNPGPVRTSGLAFPKLLQPSSVKLLPQKEITDLLKNLDWLHTELIAKCCGKACDFSTLMTYCCKM